MRLIHRFSSLKFAFVLFMLILGTNMFAQVTLLNLSFKNATLHEILLEIKKQSGQNIVFNNNLIDKYNNESFNLRSISLEDALKKILEGKALSYKISDGVIIIEPLPEKQEPEKTIILNQTIKGTVLDIETNTPLIGATVVILNSNPTKGTATDLDGNYRLEKTPVGRYNIQVSYVGYESKVITEVLVTSAKEVVINVGLKQSLTQMKEVVVTVNKAKPLNSMATISARSFTVEETRRYAGGMDDPARMASAFAGVAVGNLQNNGIVIRGNSPKGVSWRLEDIDIPNPNHLAGQVEGGGVVTIFSSQLLANSDFYTGAFPAEYGNAMSGVFDMKLRNGNKEKYEHTFQAGLMGIDFASEGPINTKQSSSYLINYRYSTIGLLNSLGLLSLNETAKYQDLSFKLNFPTKKAGTFSLWGIGGMDSDHGPNKILDSSEWKYSYDRLPFVISQKMGACGLSNRYIVGEKTYVRNTIAASGMANNWNQIRIDDSLRLRPQTYDDNNSGKITLSSMLNHKFSAHNTLRVGINHHQLYYNLTVNSTIKDNPDSYQNFIREKGKTTLTELYFQDKYDITEKLSFTGGLHFNYFSLNGNHTFEPRAALKWQFANNQSISLGYGKHSQLEDMRIYLIKLQQNANDYFPNKNLGFSQANHFVIGYDWSISDNVRLKVEPYFQYLYNVPGIKDSSYSMINFSQNLSFHDALVNNSQGRNIGVDVTLERFLNHNFYYMVTFSVFNSRYKTDEGVWRDTRYNKGFVTNWLFGKEFFLRNDKVLGLNGRFNILGGDHYSPYMADPINKDVVYDETKAFQKQYPPTSYLDITITYRINKLKYSGVWALQVKNILLTPSHNGFFYNYQTGNADEYDIRIMLPSLSYKIEF
jgi:hypothetical protein